MSIKKYPEKLKDSHGSILYQYIKVNGGKTVYELMDAFNLKKTSTIDILRSFIISGRLERRTRYEVQQNRGRPLTEFVCSK